MFFLMMAKMECRLWTLSLFLIVVSGVCVFEKEGIIYFYDGDGEMIAGGSLNRSINERICI